MQLCVTFLFVVVTTALVVGEVPVALGGYDVVECRVKGPRKGGCKAIGAESMSTEYTSVDDAGNPIFTSTFLFTTQDNMIAFENAPFSYAPRLGGFCAGTLSTMKNSSSTLWNTSQLGPPVDLIHSWRTVESPDGLPASLYLFGSEDLADEFIKNLPESQTRAESTWSALWGSHGTVAPYALSAGPFNSVCFTEGDPNATNPPRDCAKDPQQIPTK